MRTRAAVYYKTSVSTKNKYVSFVHPLCIDDTPKVTTMAILSK